MANSLAAAEDQTSCRPASFSTTDGLGIRDGRLSDHLDSACCHARSTGAPGGDFENIHADSDISVVPFARSLEGFGSKCREVSNECFFQIARQQREVEDRTRHPTCIPRLRIQQPISAVRSVQLQALLPSVPFRA